MRPKDDPPKEGSVLMLTGTFTPPSVPLNLKSYWGSWKVVANSDAHALDQDLRRVGWSLFFIAGKQRGYSVGTGGEGSVKRAMRRVLGKVGAEGFNCAQIANVAVKRFLGVPYVRIEAYSRHLQLGSVLETFKQRTQASAAAAWSVG